MAAEEIVKAVYRCAACEKTAATVALLPHGAHDPELDARALRHAPATLISHDVCGRHALAVSAGRVAAITRTLRESAKAASSQAGGELSHSYCPKCRACYCADHWKMADRYEDLRKPGDQVWYDSTWGVCPKGHRVMLDD